MPKRSNLEQAVIYEVERRFASDELEVTQSEELLDHDSGKPREVDIVMTSKVGGFPVVVSMEITAPKRKSSVTWVESMLSKHSRMPTAKLILVSWSGFSEAAMTKIAAQGGTV